MGIKNKKLLAQKPKTLVDVVVPVHNELFTDIQSTLSKVEEYLQSLSKDANFAYTITIACSASPEDTTKKARRLAQSKKQFRFVQEKLAGRGRALKKAWQSSNSDIVAYMDVDLATSLESLDGLLKPLLEGFNGITIGNRKLRQSVVRRRKFRQLFSNFYALACRLFLGAKIKDMQCGFKAMPTKLAKELTPKVQNNHWMFDSELLLLAERSGYKIKSVPVKWQESKSSTIRFGSLLVESLGFINRIAQQKRRLITPERLIIATILMLSGVVFFVRLTNNGWANIYYSAATEAGSTGWKAFLFGSFDSQNFITIDKFPLVIWPSVIAVKIFGFSQFAILLPHAATGVLVSYLLYKLVRRFFGVISGVVASLLFIFLPLSIMMFRFNNPDTFLTLCSLLIAGATYKAWHSKRWQWFVVLGVLMGVAFQLKTLQALIFVVPVVAVWLWEARVCRTKNLIKNASTGIIAFLVTALWWPVMVSFTNASNRPNIGGSQANSVWDLIFGYNGLSRLTGSGSAKITGEVTAVFGGAAGPLRMLNDSFFSNIGWFLLPAMVVAIYSVWYCWQYNSQINRPPKSQLIFWSVFLLAHIAVFSFAKGKIHAYYSLVIVPAISVMIGVSLWYLREVTVDMHNKLAYWLAGSVVLTIAILIPNTLKAIDPQWGSWLFWPLIVGGATLLIIYIFIAFSEKLKLLKLLYILGLVVVFFVSGVSARATFSQAYSGYVPSAMPRAYIFYQIPPLPTADTELFKLLNDNTQGDPFIAATENSFDGAVIQLSTRRAVLALGGFDGHNEIVNKAKAEELIKQKKVRYFLAWQSGGINVSGDITKWVIERSHKCNVQSNWSLYALEGAKCPKPNAQSKL